MSIGGASQPMPAYRRNVRVVGPRFLPDASQSVELNGETAARARDMMKLENAQ
ncbi:hypothetical protein [Mesorhizobium sp. M7A.F.Ca.US.006.01.1.1]|uniref:hypothetical protein n=1 Tax=Mesorhizobium sp. M7A.F.Ca.US.006.01.1.1 TaxID=2496707 RepID=UPI0013E2F4A9|nr:hypothetical protein [Mesorhizobium sp. M7A.F.Ca.US.006.01.1.1]